MSVNGSNQYIRSCKLLVSNKAGLAIDLSDFRIKFSVKRADTATPNSADIRVYNLSSNTAAELKKKEYTNVTLQAGYQDNLGVIFQGNVIQVIAGRESATDTFVDIIAGDGDRAYNYAVVSTPIAKGSTEFSQLQLAMAPMLAKGVTPGYINVPSTTSLPRGKVLYGNSRDYMIQIGQTTNTSFSIQNEKIQFVPIGSILPGEVVTLNSQTGLIGSPQQTDQGVNCKCLLNPLLRVGGQVFLNESIIQRLKVNLTIPNSASNIPAPLTTDGVYYIYVVEHSGDNRGTDWYSNLVTLNTTVIDNPINSVQVNRGDF